MFDQPPGLALSQDIGQPPLRYGISVDGQRGFEGVLEGGLVLARHGNHFGIADMGAGRVTAGELKGAAIMRLGDIQRPTRAASLIEQQEFMGGTAVKTIVKLGRAQDKRGGNRQGGN